MANRYGTDEIVFQTITGTLQSDDGSPLLSTSSDGGTAYALGGALSAGIYSGIQNGNLASPPQSIGTGNPISADNPLPYFTFVDSSSGRITASAVEDSTQASGYSIRFQAVGAQAGDTAYLERNIAIPSSRAQSYMFSARATWYAGTNNANYRAFVQSQYLKADGTSTTGTLGSGTRSGTALANAVEIYALGNASGAIPSDGASLRYQTGISFASAVAGTVTVDLVEMRLVTGTTVTPYVDQTNPGSYGGYVGLSDSLLQIAANGYGTAGSNPTIFLSGNTGTIYLNAAGTISGGGTPTSGDIELRHKDGGYVYIGEGTANADTRLYVQSAGVLAMSTSLAVVGSIGFGAQIYGSTALNGPSIGLAGTNNRLWSFSSSDGAADVATSTSSGRAGILVTKSVTGQPSTNVNGTATTDAFADALRNGGLAVDSTNARLYAYSGGAWRYAALTTPSDSRLKKDIHEISGALAKLRELAPVSFKWKKPESHPRTDAVIHNEENFGFIADHVATTSLGHWVETMGAGEYEKEYVEDETLLAVNIPQNEIEALIVQSLIDLENRIAAIEEKL